MIVAGRNKKTTLNLRLFDEEKDEVQEMAERYDVAAADLLMFALDEIKSRGVSPNNLANFVVSRHNPKLAQYMLQNKIDEHTRNVLKHARSPRRRSEDPPPPADDEDNGKEANG